jgi:hypothetical protein
MSMEDLEKKLFAQLDDPMPGQRGQALDMLHAHDEKNKSSFRDRLAKIERGELYDALDREAAALRQQNTALDGELTQYKAAVAKWQKHAAAMQSKLAIASAIAWGRTTGLRLAAYAALPLIALIGWQGYERYWPLPVALQSGLQEIAASTAWGQGCGQAVVRRVDGQPYWVLPCGRIDTTSHLTAQGRPIGLHCLDLYATAATSDWREYVKANPYGLFGWWIQWPRRAVQCEPFEIREAEQ